MFSKYSNILVAVNGSPQSFGALNRASSLAKMYQANLCVLQVVPGSDQDFILDDGKVINETIIIIRSLFKNFEKSDKVEIFQIVGIPKWDIINFSIDKNVDLIVVGATCLKKIESKLIGSTSSYVVNHAFCDVLVKRY